MVTGGPGRRFGQSANPAGAHGKRLDRPRIDATTEQRIRAALAMGDRGILRIAADLGVVSGTVQRLINKRRIALLSENATGL